MDKINEYLTKLDWTFDMLVQHLDTVYRKKLRDRERYKEYFAKNKDKIYKYHEKYRKNKKKNEIPVPEQTS